MKYRSLCLALMGTLAFSSLAQAGYQDNHVDQLEAMTAIAHCGQDATEVVKHAGLKSITGKYEFDESKRVHKKTYTVKSEIATWRFRKPGPTLEIYLTITHAPLEAADMPAKWEWNCNVIQPESN